MKDSVLYFSNLRKIIKSSIAEHNYKLNIHANFCRIVNLLFQCVKKIEHVS
jgi:hypothetical protein